ncbi:MAG: phosphatase PAP2 family protein [Ignavibacteria bacterium]|nr:phosphatase PAP2 family protein [Ignavibacteria bacterium]
MKQNRFISLVLCVAFICAPSSAQFKGQNFAEKPISANLNVESTDFSSNIFEGFTNLICPWDLSLVALGGLSYYKPNEEGTTSTLEPLAVDLQISGSVARNDGRESLGSRLHPGKIQTNIFIGQLAITSLLDIATDAHITASDYERSFVFAKALLYTVSITEISKNLLPRIRPDGSNNRSFFSGHVSSSFTTSAFIYREISDWIDGMESSSHTSSTLLKGTAFAACYGWATYVGYSRIRDRKHYLSDVLVGAAVGTVIGNFIYDLHFDNEDQSTTSVLQFSFNPAVRPSVGLTYHF